MKRVELYLKVRRAAMIDGMSRRGAAAYFGNNRKTVNFETWPFDDAIFVHQLTASASQFQRR
jgi:hypothetical protein